MSNLRVGDIVILRMYPGMGAGYVLEVGVGEDGKGVYIRALNRDGGWTISYRYLGSTMPKIEVVGNLDEVGVDLRDWSGTELMNFW